MPDPSQPLTSRLLQEEDRSHGGRTIFKLLQVVLLCTGLALLLSTGRHHSEYLTSLALSHSLSARSSLQQSLRKPVVQPSGRIGGPTGLRHVDYPPSVWQNALSDRVRQFTRPAASSKDNAVVAATSSAAAAIAEPLTKAGTMPAHLGQRVNLLRQIRNTVVDAFAEDGSASWVTEADVERMLKASDGDVASAEEMLHDAVQWRKESLEAWMPSRNRLANVMPTGHRNLVYMSAAHQRQSDDIAAQWACSWEMAVRSSPDPSAQFDFVLDMHGFQPWLNVNIGPLLKLAPAFTTYFAERIHRVIIIDVSTAALWIWAALRKFLPPQTVDRVKFVSRQNPKDMESLYELAQNQKMHDVLTQLVDMGGHLTPKSPTEPWLRVIDEYTAKEKQHIALADA